MNEETIRNYASIEAIKAEIEGAKLDNEIRKMQGRTTFNYLPDYFFEKSKELQRLSVHTPPF